MLEVMQTRADRLEDVAAGTHVDGGARVQTVTEESNPLYHAVISAFAEQTGVPAIINTSFNIRGEPIVHSVSDALKCYYTTDMDALAIGPFLLEKSAAAEAPQSERPTDSSTPPAMENESSAPVVEDADGSQEGVENEVEEP